MTAHDVYQSIQKSWSKKHYFANVGNFYEDAKKKRGCLYTEPGIDAGLDNFSLSRHFHVLQVPRPLLKAWFTLAT